MSFGLEQRFCAGCEQFIVYGDFLERLGEKWHHECFKCNTCNAVLNPVSYREKDSKPYCLTGVCLKVGGGQTEYADMQSTANMKFFYMCAKCGKDIQHDVVLAGDKWYHKDHFSCEGCRHVITAPGQYFTIEGELYCNVDCCKKYKPVAACDNTAKDFSK